MAAAQPRTVPRSVNVIVRAVLRSPAHRLMSRNTMLLSFSGRRTGTAYTLPVSYCRDGENLTCFTDGTWWKNLRDPAPVRMVVAGRRLTGVGEVVTQDHQSAVDALRTFLHRTPRDAKYHGVRTGADGEYLRADLERAARAATMVRIRPAP
ncbi:uncharacterized protein DUF385 [Actinocorallia herbida]|uniref:Uncharacterized protein DUF385 n=1 Tax=Actinocorallia herbida TaxID=58109 RepID=A0A3N1CXX1_9ACTN|nr:nitroreductase/quinone reductase family protein [Actinocorallia herbida]ROO86150.1 uncharacterized protein DUF385 [Actinocorallia herbida]